MKPLPRYLGGILGVIALLWGVLRKGDEFLGVVGLVTSRPATAFYAILAEWGWLLLLIFAVCVLLWGDPRSWGVWQRRASRYISLAQALRYIGERSVWSRACPEKMSVWNTSLPRDVRDALSLGQIRATGRPSKNGGHSRDNHNARVNIPAAFWERAWFQAIPNTVSNGEKTDVVYVHDGKVEAAFIEVELLKNDVRKVWPPLWPWERIDSPIAKVREGRSDE